MVLLSTRTPPGDGERRLGRHPVRAGVAVGSGTDMGPARSVVAQPDGCSPGVDGGAGDGAPGKATRTRIVCALAARSCIPPMHQIVAALRGTRLPSTDEEVATRNISGRRRRGPRSGRGRAGPMGETDRSGGVPSVGVRRGAAGRSSAAATG